MHDDKLRGTGTFIWKVYLRRKGSDRADTHPEHSMTVRTKTASESSARGQAQIEMDAQGMKQHYPAEVQPWGRY